MSTEKQQTFSSTKDLKRTLGKKELMGIAIGQIIGAGIMSMMGVAIAMTGRSANLAFMLSAVFTMCTFFPSIFITSCIRMRGGMYTQFAIFAGDKWAGYYSVFTSSPICLWLCTLCPSLSMHWLCCPPAATRR